MRKGTSEEGTDLCMDGARGRGEGGSEWRREGATVRGRGAIKGGPSEEGRYPGGHWPIYYTVHKTTHNGTLAIEPLVEHITNWKYFTMLSLL